MHGTAQQEKTQKYHQPLPHTNVLVLGQQRNGQCPWCRRGFTTACLMRALQQLVLLSTSPNNVLAGDSSWCDTLQSSNAHRPNQRSNTARLAVNQHQPPQCFITPANAAYNKTQPLLPQSALGLPPVQPPTSHASPRTPAEARNPRSRHSHADNAENDFLSQLQIPGSLPGASRTAQKRRKQKRPQWQDVSIDLSAVQAAQEQAGPMTNHADRPVGPMPAIDTARTAHMSGVSPASPSPPKQHPQNMPLPSHKSRSSVPTLPALAPALAAWHENMALDQACAQQYQHRHGQSVGEAREPPPMSSRMSQHPQSRQSPSCLPPLHHHQQPRASHPPPSSADCTSSQSQSCTEVPNHQSMPFSCNRQGQYTHFLSSSHHALQATTDSLPSSSYQHADIPDGLASNPSRRFDAENPRTAQQVPMQYMRHPCGSGAPGGLHRLHCLLRPLARSQQHAADSSSVGGPITSAGAAVTSAGTGITSCATNALAEAPQQSHEDIQAAAAAVAAREAMLQPWQSQASQHEQRRAVIERPSKPGVRNQQPLHPEPAVHHRGWQQHDLAEQQQQRQQQQQEQDQLQQQQWQQQQAGSAVRRPFHDTSSAAAQAAGDVQDVHQRLHQVKHTGAYAIQCLYV